MNIHHHIEGSKGRFVAGENNAEAGFMTYSQAGADK